MSLMLAPVPAAPDAPTFTPPESAPQLERSPRFGPALSDARERLARAEPKREPRPTNETKEPNRPDEQRPSTNDVAADEPEGPNEPVDEDSETGEASDVASEPAEESDDGSAAAAAVDDEVVAAPTAATPDVVAAFVDLPAEAGAEGAGSPSTSDSIEEVAAPIITNDTVAPSEEATDDAAVVASRVRTAVAENPSATASAVGPFVLGRAISPETDSAGSVSTTSATPGAAAVTDVSAPVAETMEQVAPTSGDAAPTADVEGGDDVAPTATPIESVETDAASTVSETETVDAAAPKPLVTTTVNAEATDRMVVRAGEAAAADVAKAAATAQQPTDGPEGSLWEDVRSAFERIRSNGETNEVRIRLRPAELGELVVQVRTQGDHVAVRLLASSAAAQQALLDDRLRLASELALAGFEEGSVDIDQQMAGDPRSQNGQRDGDGEDRPTPRSIDMLGGLDHVGSVRERFERRNPIHTEVGFRPGRHAYSTINLTL